MCGCLGTTMLQGHPREEEEKKVKVKERGRGKHSRAITNKRGIKEKAQSDVQPVAPT